MANLFDDIEEQILDCIDAETGEVIDIERLESLEMERDAKISSICRWIKNLRADAEMYKTQKMHFAKMQSVADNKADSLEQFIASYVTDTWDKDPQKRVKITFRQSTSVDVDLDRLMITDDCDQWLRYKLPEPKKDEIARALKAGQIIEGCELVTKRNIQIK